jgi:hypothetical protein
MKNSYYFPHDYHARHDPKLERLFLTMGYEGVGIYWCLIEMLYEQSGKILLMDIPLYAKEPELYQSIDKVINNFSLFENDGQHFWSLSVLKRLQFREEKSKKSSISALKRWDNANAMPTQCEGNAFKGKERKGKEIKEKETTAFDEVWLLYPKRVGRKQALKHFNASVFTVKDLDDMKKALQNYLAHLKEQKTEVRYIKNGDTWFNNWRDYIDFKPTAPMNKPTQPVYKAPPESEKFQFVPEVNTLLKNLANKKGI